MRKLYPPLTAAPPRALGGCGCNTPQGGDEQVKASSWPEVTTRYQHRADLQAQREGIQNRITVARNRRIKAVQACNAAVRSFPSKPPATAFGFNDKANIASENECEVARPPAVTFDNPVPGVVASAASAASR
jgi:LemA protein